MREKKNRPSVATYLGWLMKKLDYKCKHGEVLHFSEFYGELATYLWSMPFTFDNPMDENRVQDVFEMRERFSDELRISFEDELNLLDANPPSLFEVMITLADRMNYILEGRVENASVALFFTELLENLDMLKYDNTYVDEHRDTWISELDEKVDILINRRYGCDGFGSFFPLKTVTELDIFNGVDQSKNEIWYQMHHYISQKYPFV